MDAYRRYCPEENRSTRNSWSFGIADSQTEVRRHKSFRSGRPAGYILSPDAAGRNTFAFPAGFAFSFGLRSFECLAAACRGSRCFRCFMYLLILVQNWFFPNRNASQRSPVRTTLTCYLVLGWHEPIA